MKIRYLLYFCTIYQLLVFRNAEPIIGENVWPAMSNEFPFIASLGVKNPNTLVERGHICGGSLITGRHVLTAAHCLEMFPKNKVDVIVGEKDLTTARFKYDVDSWITYNDWAKALRKPTEYPGNDIAIIRLSTTVNRADVRSVTLSPLNNERLYGINAVIVGWGLSNEGNLMDVLQRARVTILTPEQCGEKVKLITNEYLFMEKNIMCSLADPYALVDCGDSGGPLLDKKNVLLGIISSTCPNEIHQWGNFSLQFLHKYKVNRHTSVDYYRDFIENVTGLLTRPREDLAFGV